MAETSVAVERVPVNQDTLACPACGGDLRATVVYGGAQVLLDCERVARWRWSSDYDRGRPRPCPWTGQTLEVRR